ncbi:MAG TPA: DUF1552 domain-containing protein, partial [Polyangia bacterium]|nr:DUF1552 domain-containing protein [Polyangia bacterium]
MSSYKFARRSFLRAAGGSAALLAPLLRSIEARAQGKPAPLRLLIIHHPLGCGPGLGTWRPSATATTTNFTLPLETAPFGAAATPLQKYMCMVDGLNVLTPSGQNTHEGGLVAVMTGLNALGKGSTQQDWAAGGASIDQLLLNKSPLLGGPTQKDATMFGSLQLGADVRSDRNEVAPRVLSYKAPIAGSDPLQRRQPLYPDTSPLNVFGRIFGVPLPTGADPQKVLAQKLSVCDFMRKDIARLQSLIPASEKDRLAAQLISITQLEASLRQAYSSTSGSTSGSCKKPETPPTYANTSSGRQMDSVTYTTGAGVDYYVGGSPNSHPHLDLGLNQLRLIKTAFACDLVRVATFMWSAGTNWVVFPGTFQGASIRGNPQSSPHHPPSHSDPSGDTQTRDWLNQINQFYSTATATALQEFATTPDVDGNMLLDNTVVVYLSEVARAWDHNQQNMPLIVFGGKNTGIKGGTYLKVTGGSLPQQTGGSG